MRDVRSIQQLGAGGAGTLTCPVVDVANDGLQG